ncbi:hypothetical protein [Sphaerisporangium sp. NPDC051011]|uniref:hypothetical protein n=1 Tax=Sphaerisporangium sp. NPDC051011 TaxID=3155792 RepID=UPI0033FC6D74
MATDPPPADRRDGQEGNEEASPGDGTPERPPSGDDTDDTDDALDEGRLDQNATVINNFWAKAHLSDANLGAGGRRSSRAAVGRLPAEEIEVALRRFMAPAMFAKAVDILRTRHVVVLCGAEESGRWTGAIAALAQMNLKGDGVWMYSPATPLNDLLTKPPFRPGRGYMLHDWIEAGLGSAVSRFELANLTRKVAEISAYLVVTVRRDAQRRPFDEIEVAWDRPDPGLLFDSYLKGIDFPDAECDDLRRLRARAVEAATPGRVTRLAEQVIRRERSPSQLLAEVEDEVVARWFAGSIQRTDVLVVCVVAFAHGAPERVFERLLARLVSVRDQFAAVQGLDVRREDAQTLPRTRASWSREHPLITVEAEGGAGFAGERRVVFRSEQYREQVVKALAEQYGYELWEPLREWIRSLADDNIDVQFQAAVGVALLARVAPQEVMESFLDPWAAGLMHERLAAANVLALMCADDESAPMVLNLVLIWADNAGQERAMTAALALATGVWIRYPTDALNWLWYLALRGQRVRAVARLCLVLLFRQAAGQGEALTVVRLLVGLVDEEMTGRGGTRRTRTALDAVVDLLSAESLEADDPLPAHLLITSKEVAGPLGTLWARAFASNAHRAPAVHALRRTLQALDGREGAVPLAAALGASVWSALPPEWVSIVERDLRRGLTGSGEDARLTRDLVNALLASVRRPGRHALGLRPGHAV